MPTTRADRSPDPDAYYQQVADVCAIAIRDALRTIPNRDTVGRRWVLTLGFPETETETVVIKCIGNLSSPVTAAKLLTSGILELTQMIAVSDEMAERVGLPRLNVDDTH